MNKGVIVGSVVLAVSAFAMTALAQVDIASTTPQEVATTPEATSTTTDSASSTPAIENATSTPPTETTPDTAAPVDESTSESEGMVEGAATSLVPASATVQSISALQDAYFEKNGKYLQVLPSGDLPDYESGTVAEKLGAGIPAGARVDVYESPEGFGYQITYEDKDTIYTVGFGPEAADRTYSRQVPFVVASSTLVVSDTTATSTTSAPNSAATTTETAPTAPATTSQMAI